MLAKEEGRIRRKRRIRKNMQGSTERPRLTVFRSNKHIYAQAVDDSEGRTLAAVCSMKTGNQGKTVDAAKAVGEAIAKALKEKGVEKVVFDRNGYIYHGRVKALADAAREAGLKF